MYAAAMICRNGGASSIRVRATSVSSRYTSSTTPWIKTRVLFGQNRFLTAPALSANAEKDGSSEGAKDTLSTANANAVASSTIAQTTAQTTLTAATTGDASTATVHPFEEFEMSPVTVRNLQKAGIRGLFPVQKATYDLVLNGSDVVVKARTGSGKTLAFVLPLVERIRRKQQKGDAKSGPLRNSASKYPLAVVVCPTRELAKQVASQVQLVAPDLRTLACYGGVSSMPQQRALREGIDFLVCTPGRMIDLVEGNHLNLSQVETLCLDEADHMLDIGFEEDMERIMQAIRTHQSVGEGEDPKHGTILYSATMPVWIKKIARKYLSSDYQLVDLVGQQQSVSSIEYLGVPCEPAHRLAVLGERLKLFLSGDSAHQGGHGSNGQVLIFTETKSAADEVAQSLVAHIQKCGVLHGNVSQQSREEVLRQFRSGQLKVVVATDVAARGLDIPSVDLVVHMEITRSHEQFIHRSGRTGRAGKTGSCMVFYDPVRELRDLLHLESKLKLQFKKIPAGADHTFLLSRELEGLQKKFSKVRLSSSSVHDLHREHASALWKSVQEQDKEAAVEDVLARILALTTSSNASPRSALTGQPGLKTVEIQPSDPNLLDSRATLDWFSKTRDIFRKLPHDMKVHRGTKGWVVDVPEHVDTAHWVEEKIFPDSKVVECAGRDAQVPELQISQYGMQPDRRRGGNDGRRRDDGYRAGSSSGYRGMGNGNRGGDFNRGGSGGSRGGDYNRGGSSNRGGDYNRSTGYNNNSSNNNRGGLAKYAQDWAHREGGDNNKRFGGGGGSKSNHKQSWEGRGNQKRRSR